MQRKRFLSKWRQPARLSQAFLLAVVLVLLAACSDGGNESFSTVAEAPAASDARFEGEVMEEALAYDDAVGASAVVNQAQNEPPSERLIIRTAELNLLVKKTEETIAEISRIAESTGGWVVNSSVSQFGEAKRGDITVRVPSTGFTGALETFKGLAIEVEFESTSGQDVTEEFVDLGSRLGNLEATADRVRGFLDETENVEEALAVNVELSRLESEIEIIKGRMQYLSQSAAFSTIHVSLTPDILSTPIEVGGWRPQGVARDAIESLVGFLQGVGSILIWLGIFVVPLALIIGLPSLFIIRRLRRRIAARTDSMPSLRREPTAVSRPDDNG